MYVHRICTQKPPNPFRPHIQTNIPKAILYGIVWYAT